jgi:hypothetical protein
MNLDVTDESRASRPILHAEHLTKSCEKTYRFRKTSAQDTRVIEGLIEQPRLAHVIEESREVATGGTDRLPLLAQFCRTLAFNESFNIAGQEAAVVEPPGQEAGLALFQQA